MVSGIKQKCDFCSGVAKYDTMTKMGPWAFVCDKHFEVYSIQQPGFYTVLEPIVLKEKVCPRCEEPKALTDFYTYKDGHRVERYRTECKVCNLAEKKKQSFKPKKVPKK